MLASALLCLSLNMYYEARSEPVDAQIAVAAITMNRMLDEDHPRSVCKVVYEKGAFSWTSKKRKVDDKKSFNKIKELAYLYVSGKVRNPIGKRKYFNHKRLGKRWKTPNHPIKIGKLLYY